MIAPRMTLRSMLSMRNAIGHSMNTSTGWPDEMESQACEAINGFEVAIMKADAVTADDAVVKLVTLAQVVAEGHEPNELEAALAILAAQRHFGAGYVDPHRMNEVRAERPFALTSAPSQYRMAQDGYSAARARFMALPESLETDDEMAFRAEERLYLAAVDRLTAAEPGDCREFVEWYLVLTDEGASAINEDVRQRMAAVAKRLCGAA